VQQTTISQKTIRESFVLQGKGVHGGEHVSMHVLPAPPNHGIVFVRADLPGSPEVKAELDSLSDGDLFRRTTLRRGDAEIHTVEHFLSAVWVFGITNLRVEVTASELPFLDGSALPFVDAISRSGVEEQEGELEVLSPLEPLAFAFNGAEISVVPDTKLRVTFFFTSSQPLLRSQSASFVIAPETYKQEIAPARTFAFFEEIELLRKRGLIRGGSLKSAVVIGRKSILNNSLRFPDEPVRHKILDFIGDMALLNCHVHGHFLVWRSGHSANAAFAKFLRKELAS